MKIKLFKWMSRSNIANKALLFLHGMGGTGAIWRPIAAQLEENYLCFAPDQRGHGESRPVPKSEKYRFHADDYASDVENLFQDEIIAPTWIIGHSMGVRTALALTARFSKKQSPDPIQGLIAVDIGVSDAWGGGIGLPLAHFIEHLPKTFSTKIGLREYLFQHCPDPSIAQYLSAVAKNNSTPGAEMQEWSFPFDHEALVETIHQANEAKMEDNLEKTLSAGMKVLFLRGAQSRVWLKEDYEKQKNKFSHPLLTFEEWENCGHGLPFEQRTRFVEKINRYCQ